jgi:hypothetical protein
VQDLMTQLGAGQLTPVTALLWLLIAGLVAMAGGAVAGIRLAGKDLGTELAAMMGAMFGPTAALPAVLAGLVVLAMV